MMRIPAKLSLLLGALSILLVTACAEEPVVPKTSSPRAFSGQTGYRGVAADLLGSAQGQSELVTVGSGNIAGDGSFSFEFDTAVPDAVLSAQTPLCPELEPRLVFVGALNVLDGPELLGDLVQASSTTRARGSGDGTQAVRVYAEQPLQAEGSCENIAYSFDFDRGWNIVNVFTRGEALTYTSGNTDLAWRFVAVED